MIFHVDANSFYASCERLFRPDLAGRAIIVLSNNDGIVVALNAEAKAKGLSRGDAYFKIEETCARENVAVFSSNYTLYADISARLVSIYNRLCPDVEIYSIDECFLYYPDWKCPDYDGIARHIKATVQKETGIPVSIGVAPTRTLAKLCNKLAKKRGGVLSYADIDPDSELAAIPVGDVWGIGWSKQKLLERNGVRTAKDLARYPLELAKKNLTITGFRTVQELNGIPANERTEIEKRQNICSSKSFGQAVFSLPELEEALSEYAHEAVSRVREQKSAVRYVSIFLMTNPWDEAGPQYCNQLSAALDAPTSFLPDILSVALDLLRRLYRPGYRYRKVMINLLGLEDDEIVQQELFDSRETRSAAPVASRAERAVSGLAAFQGFPGPIDLPCEGPTEMSGSLVPSPTVRNAGNRWPSRPPRPAARTALAGLPAVPDGPLSGVPACAASPSAGVPDRSITAPSPADQSPAERRTIARAERQALMKCFDAINARYGRNMLALGALSLKARTWNMQRNFLSPAYTTDLSGIPAVY
jgi:DNA polymerase V